MLCLSTSNTNNTQMNSLRFEQFSAVVSINLIDAKVSNPCVTEPCCLTTSYYICGLLISILTMHRYFLRLSYKGTHYSGWQIQENAISVQEKLNQALSLILDENIQSVGCGRTDTGVHAKQFYAHFDCSRIPADAEKVIYQVNAVLPYDISIAELIPVDADAHSRYDATSRTYEYFIAGYKNPFLKEFAMHGFMNPDPDLMNEACSHLFNYNDFTSFSKSNTQVKTNICTITAAKWVVKNDLMIFTISADRFLRGMVRAVVGTMIDIGTGKIDPDKMAVIIESKNRKEAGFSVPACGLFLSKIEYPYLSNISSPSFPA